MPPLRSPAASRCRTTKFPREVPPLPWYRTTLPQMAMAGFLPFSAIYIELYYIFASIWGYKVRGWGGCEAGNGGWNRGWVGDGVGDGLRCGTPRCAA